MSIGIAVHDFLVRRRVSVMLFWVGMVLIGLFFGMDYVRDSEDIMRAPEHSRAANDKKAFAAAFPEQADANPVVVFLRCKSPEDKECFVVCPKDQCTRKCPHEREDIRKYFKTLETEFMSWSEQHGSLIQRYISYYNFSETHLDKAKCQFSPLDGRSTFALFQYSFELSKSDKHDINSALEDLIKSIELPDDLKVGITGADSIAKEITDDSEQQLMRVDIITMPIALILFSTMVRSWRLLILCMIGAFVTTLSSFGTLSLLVKATGQKPMSTMTTMCEALALSMSIDYCLFLHRRFRDEIKNGEKLESAVRIMFLQAGEVVGLSCATFCMVFVGFLFLASADLAGLGRVAVVTLIIAFCANVSLSVAAISQFPNFFSKFSFSPESNAEERLLTSTGAPRNRRGAPYRGCYFNFVKKTTAWPYNVILICFAYVIVIPLATQAFRLQHNQDALAIAPRHGPARNNFVDLQASFEGGLLAPFYLVVHMDGVNARSKGKDGAKIFEVVSQVTKVVADYSGMEEKYFSSPANLQGKPVPHSLGMDLLNSDSALCRIEKDLCALYQYEFDMAVNPTGDTIVITASLPFNPFGTYGMEFVDDAIEAIDGELKDLHVYLCGSEVEMYADMKLAFDDLPYLLLGTCLIVFLLLGVGFRSVMVPVRLSLTVFAPLAAVFGLAVLVYQEGILNWTHISAFEKAEGGFFWFIPLLCIFQALGLVLDYDVFSTHRILEHRANGYDMQAAIIKAVWETNSTITVAGLIMASVFGGMILSSQVAVNQFGFLLSFSVLFDTFCVQSILMPAILSLNFAQVAWWPRKMPETDLITLDDPEFSDKVDPLIY